METVKSDDLENTYQGEERRKRNDVSLMILMHEEYKLIHTRIAEHKKEFKVDMEDLKNEYRKDMGEVKAQLKLLKDAIMPDDGKATIHEKIRKLEDSEERRKKDHDRITNLAIGGIASLFLTVAAWVGKLLLSVFKLIGN